MARLIWQWLTVPNSFRMWLLGKLYPLRAALGMARAARAQPDGPTFWAALWRGLTTPGRPAPLPAADYTPAGRIAEVRVGEAGRVEAQCALGGYQIQTLARDLALIRYRSDGAFDEPFSYSVIKPPEEWQPPRAQVEHGEQRVSVAVPGLRLTLNTVSGAMTVEGGDGAPLLLAPAGPAVIPGSGRLLWQAEFEEGTPFYGLGEKADRLNHAGNSFELWNSDPAMYDRGDDPIYMSVPFVMALVDGQAVGLFFDRSYWAQVGCGVETPGRLTYQTDGGELRLYVMVGPPATVLERFTELTGRAPLPPLWALGFHQSRWSYTPQSRVLEVAEEFRRRELPCDVIHLDIHYMNGYRCFTWDGKRFPDPRGMIDTLHAQGFKALSLIDPGIKVDPGYGVYVDGLQQGAFMTYPDGRLFTGPVWPGTCVFPDFSDPAVREWWGGLYAGLLDAGLDAFWNDMNEPAIITGTMGGGAVPPGVVHSAEGRGATHDEIHNVYGLLMARASAEGLRRLQPDRRPLLLSRSGWAGLQRYAMHWTADNRSTWDHLRLSVSMVLSLGLSGIPFTGPDVGGFSGGPTPELYIRWMQLGAVLPFFRVHSMAGSPDQEPWAFGPEVEAISREYLQLRYCLLPYLYTAAWQAASQGAPLARPMSFAFPGDAATYDLDDQFMLGDSLLAAPVLEPGAATREVYLPEGPWFDFWTGRGVEGGGRVTVDAPLEVLPLFVRGGAVIPLGADQQYVGEVKTDVLDLYAYATPGRFASRLYEDDGETPDAEAADAYRLSRFVLNYNVASGRLTFSRAVERGAYTAGCHQFRVHLIGARPGLSLRTMPGARLLREPEASERGLVFEVEAAGDFALNLGS